MLCDTDWYKAQGEKLKLVDYSADHVKVYLTIPSHPILLMLLLCYCYSY